ncbi:MAG: hypothetical protein OHK0015_44440 [Chloroflexi bacterium OHK40]
MGGWFGSANKGQRIALERYRQTVISRLAAAMTEHQRHQLCRGVVELALAECTRVVELSAQHGDHAVAEAVGAAQAWLDHGAHPGKAIERRLDDFYNPFWLAFSVISSNLYEYALAAALCTEYAVRAASAGEWAQACQEAVRVVDLVAQATGGEREDARQQAEYWQIAAAWAILHN